MSNSAFVIAAPTSGSGKTSITLGLLKAFKDKGMKIQPFKCGPDYIDTMLHSKISQQPGINLDLFFNSPAELKELFNHYSQRADISIVEGVMGLFDGYDKSKGSTAAIAKTLDLPVIFIVDAKAVAYSIAPLLYGFKHFDSQLNLAGVIFNRVGSEAHYQYLKQAADDVGINSLGYIPINKEFELAERYLGLNFDKQNQVDIAVDKIAQQIIKTVDFDQLLELNYFNEAYHKSMPKKTSRNEQIKIAVSKDEAFTFTYYENIKRLEALGDIEYFSPLHDALLPDADFVYLSGGYPEKYLEKLSANKSMKQSIKDYVMQGGRLLAECGGMMYLGKQIVNEDGNVFPMVGIFDFGTSMENKKLHLGYRKLQLGNSVIKGHEFHYSQIIHDEIDENHGEIFNAKNQPVNTVLYKLKNCYASYMHLYWGNTPVYETLFELV